MTRPQVPASRSELADGSGASAAPPVRVAGFTMSGPRSDEVLAAEVRLAPEQSAEVVVGTGAVAAAVGVQTDVVRVLRPGPVARDLALPYNHGFPRHWRWHCHRQWIFESNHN
jgi:hypothetical protein